MTELEKQLLEALEACLDDSRECLKELKQNCGGDFGHHCIAEQTRLIEKAEAAIAAAEEASPNYPAVPEGWTLVKSPITDDMHRAAVKVLVRANGVDGLPQRMLDAMVAAAPPATVKDSLIVQQAPAVPDAVIDDLRQTFANAARWGGHEACLQVDVRSLLAAAPAQVEQQAPGKWQPIRTAPKNGMHILCYMETDFGGHMEPMYWSDGCWNYCLDGDYCQFTPSHWMPAPPAPTQVSGARLAAEAKGGE